ncbi:DUF3267 domain-containing protein [Fibrella sp. WM1]|uniref:DUF3267 domain-containing protein n=1 Tax=Fibrella musci TaxID=3242485 RepID=UPI003521D18E
MTVSPEVLSDLGYTLDEELPHEQLVPFVQTYCRKRNPYTVFFWAFNIVLVVLFLVFLYRQPRGTIATSLNQASLGMAFFLVVLLPVHELLHGLAYKLLGATRISIVAQWRQLVFYCLADRFVANATELRLVALTPFVVINTLLIVGMALASPPLFWMFFGALILHTGGCFGDFGMVSYFYTNRHRNPCTYDDAQLHKSFFFVKA